MISAHRRTLAITRATAIALAGLALLHCVADPLLPASSSLPDSSTASSLPSSDASEGSASPDADLDLDATEPQVVAAVLLCPISGCNSASAKSDGGTCVQLGGSCTCEMEGGCTGGAGSSIAVCPYLYRYCLGLSACVTQARYYAQCPY